MRTSYFPRFCCWLFLCKLISHQVFLCGRVFPGVSLLEVFPTPVENMARKRSVLPAHSKIKSSLDEVFFLVYFQELKFF